MRIAEGYRRQLKMEILGTNAPEKVRPVPVLSISVRLGVGLGALTKADATLGQHQVGCQRIFTTPMLLCSTARAKLHCRISV